MEFSHDYFMFNLRRERDHLLSIDDYIDWFTSGAFPEEPGVLTEIVEEGVVYSYHFVRADREFQCASREFDASDIGAWPWCGTPPNSQ